MRFLFFVMILSSFINASSQSRTICGVVADKKGKGIGNVLLFQAGDSTFITSDDNGRFCVTMKPGLKNLLFFYHTKYKYLELTPEADEIMVTLVKRYKSTNNSINYHFPNPIEGFGISLGLSSFQTDFSQFDSELGSENTRLLERTSNHLTVEFYGYIRRFYLSIETGNVENSKELDSLKLRTFSSHLSTKFGYNIVNKWIILTPTFGVLTFKSRLYNSSIAQPVTLGTYVANREIDIKLRKYFAVSGLSINIRFYDKSSSGTFVMLGLTAQYLLPLHKNTIIKSNESLLDSDNTIDFDNWNLGVTVSVLMN